MLVQCGDCGRAEGVALQVGLLEAVCRGHPAVADHTAGLVHLSHARIVSLTHDRNSLGRVLWGKHSGRIIGTLRPARTMLAGLRPKRGVVETPRSWNLASRPRPRRATWSGALLDDCRSIPTP